MFNLFALLICVATINGRRQFIISVYFKGPDGVAIADRYYMDTMPGLGWMSKATGYHVGTAAAVAYRTVFMRIKPYLTHESFGSDVQLLYR